MISWGGRGAGWGPGLLSGLSISEFYKAALLLQKIPLKMLDDFRPRHGAGVGGALDNSGGRSVVFIGGIEDNEMKDCSFITKSCMFQNSTSFGSFLVVFFPWDGIQPKIENLKYVVV